MSTAQPGSAQPGFGQHAQQAAFPFQQHQQQQLQPPSSPSPAGETCAQAQCWMGLHARIFTIALPLCCRWAGSFLSAFTNRRRWRRRGSLCGRPRPHHWHAARRQQRRPLVCACVHAWADTRDTASARCLLNGVVCELTCSFCCLGSRLLTQAVCCIVLSGPPAAVTAHPIPL